MHGTVQPSVDIATHPTYLYSTVVGRLALKEEAEVLYWLSRYPRRLEKAFQNHLNLNQQ